MCYLTPFGSQWVEDNGGIEDLGKKLLKRRKDEELPVFTPPKVRVIIGLGCSLLCYNLK